MPPGPNPPHRQVRVVLATALGRLRPLQAGRTRATLTFIAARAAALAIPDLGFAAFFIAGIAATTLGARAPLFVVAAVLLGLLCRRLDIESWALFIPGGLAGRIEHAFGPRTSIAGAAAVLLERLLLTALACAVFGHYAASLALAVFGSARVQRHATVEDVSTMAAVLVLGWLWVRARRGHLLNVQQRARRIAWAIAIVAVVVAWAAVTALVRTDWPPALPQIPSFGFEGGWRNFVAVSMAALLAAFTGFGHAIPAVGSGDSLWRVAAELEPPRIRGLRRTALLVGLYAVLITGSTPLLFIHLTPPPAQAFWSEAPLAGVVQYLAAPLWMRGLLAIALIGAAAFLLGQAARAGLTGAENAMTRLAARGVLSSALRLPHPQFGTHARAIDTVFSATVVAILAGSGHIAWLARAYAVAAAWTLGLHAAALVRLRARGAGASLQLPFTIRFGTREWAGAPWIVMLLLAASQAALLASHDAATIAATLTLGLVAVTLAVSRRPADAGAEAGEIDAFQLRPSDELSLEQIEPRPGSLLVPVRNPHSLSHVAAALRTRRDREVIVMTARLLGIDADADTLDDTVPTAAERLLFSHVLAAAERYARPVRLLVVPAHDVFDAVVAAVLRLQATEVYVGESSTISAEAQARLLGDAWERAPKSGPLDVRLVIHHASGRTDVYHLGAHAPTLNAKDFDLIHTMWLDAVKALGPHVHHHDIVRAALTTMAEQLHGPERDDALAAIRQVAKPADELAAAVRVRDFTQLRDIMRNRPASDLAELLTNLSLDDQAIVFRLLPRRDAAATFEYLSQEVREALLKTLSKEDVASLLNNMAPDDRTMFLEELPATVTRELLALLTPQERAIAVTLLGYPEGSVGRLMTPDYVAVREDWTVQQVLDYIRTHGQDSETLNVIYVVDDSGSLIDDIRIREFLLTDPNRRVSDLMDRRFAALKATDDQQTAVAAFRQHDRSALPVTDSAGMLIGIVTVDDVLDVAETEATKDIQRIGGSEALDEPYMQIQFRRMIQKRAGWLTALFFGEMLTATAMGFFETEISKAVVLALFVPLIISSGGNSGSQASTLVIRALALGELTLRDWWRVMRREIGAGLALGAILGAIGFMRITVWSAFSDIYGQYWLLVAITVAVALIGVVLWGTLVGSLLPFLLRRLGFDPAASSAPFVATLVDVTGLVIYFSVALVVLHGRLL
jgi:magnesium transporter